MTRIRRQTLPASRRRCLHYASALEEPTTIPGIIDRVVAVYGRLDCAFNNAGIYGGGPIETLDEAVWDRVMDTNLKAAFFCLQAEAAQMKQQGGGAIVFNGSVLAPIAFPGTLIYSASKGGISSLMRAAAVELGRAHQPYCGTCEAKLRGNAIPTAKSWMSTIRGHRLRSRRTSEFGFRG